METLWQDLRYGIRMLAKSPGFTAVAMLTLALGIGANAAIFSVVNAVLLRPLPYRDPDRLVRITGDLGKFGEHDIGLSVPELADLRTQTNVFEEIAGIHPINANLTGGDQPARIEGHLDSAIYFTLLGAKAALGRVFGPQDEVPGNGTVVVLSDGAWKRRFGADPKILGRQVRLDNDLYTIIGVLPPDFRHPGREIQDEAEAWIPSAYSAAPFPTPPVRGFRLMAGALARLRPGVTLAMAQDRLDSLASALHAQYPNDYPEHMGWSLRAIPLQLDLVGNVRPALLVLGAVVGLVLLIACVNIANLLLARGGARQGEIAIRLALGATRRRLVRQLLTESVLLSLAGGLIGLVFAYWSLTGLINLIPANLPRVRAIQMDGAVLGFALGMSLLTAVLFGLVPALQTTSPNLQDTLKQSGTRTFSGARNRVRAMLAVTEFALALMLVIGAVLLVRSFWNLVSVSPGFRPERLQTASVWLPVPNDPTIGPYFKMERRIDFYSKVLERLCNLPGVNAAGGIVALPLTGPPFFLPFRIEGRDEDPRQLAQAEWLVATPDYFQTMEIPLLRGRSFTEFDNQQAPRVLLASQAFARKFFPGEDPVGKHIQPQFGGPGAPPVFTIVGIVGDVKNHRLDAEEIPLVYGPVRQGVGYQMALVLRTGPGFQSSGGLAETLSREVHAVDPEIPVYGARTMVEIVSRASSQLRFTMLLVVLFAGLALLLSAVGIYGVMAYSVEQRTHEIGIRLALGAQPRDVARLVIGQGFKIAIIGVGIGLAGSFALTRLLASLLFGISATDPATFGCVAILLTGVALMASYLPARRAMLVDPIVALRYE